MLVVAAVGFEPTPPKRLVPKTSALDHSATLPSHLPNGEAPAPMGFRNEAPTQKRIF